DRALQRHAQRHDEGGAEQRFGGDSQDHVRRQSTPRAARSSASIAAAFVKLLRQTRLRSVKGTTTSVFEVDLCEVGPGAFVVNFRFGKQGKRFIEGTKT